MEFETYSNSKPSKCPYCGTGFSVPRRYYIDGFSCQNCHRFLEERNTQVRTVIQSFVEDDSLDCVISDALKNIRFSESEMEGDPTSAPFFVSTFGLMSLRDCAYDVSFESTVPGDMSEMQRLLPADVGRVANTDTVMGYVMIEELCLKFDFDFDVKEKSLKLFRLCLSDLNARSRDVPNLAATCFVVVCQAQCGLTSKKREEIMVHAPNLADNLDFVRALYPTCMDNEVCSGHNVDAVTKNVEKICKLLEVKSKVRVLSLSAAMFASKRRIEPVRLLHARSVAAGIIYLVMHLTGDDLSCDHIAKKLEISPIFLYKTLKDLLLFWRFIMPSGFVPEKRVQGDQKSAKKASRKGNGDYLRYPTKSFKPSTNLSSPMAPTSSRPKTQTTVHPTTQIGTQSFPLSDPQFVSQPSIHVRPGVVPQNILQPIPQFKQEIQHNIVIPGQVQSSVLTQQISRSISPAIPQFKQHVPQNITRPIQAPSPVTAPTQQIYRSVSPPIPQFKREHRPDLFQKEFLNQHVKTAFGTPVPVPNLDSISMSLVDNSNVEFGMVGNSRILTAEMSNSSPQVGEAVSSQTNANFTKSVSPQLMLPPDL
eukprot:814540_1